MQIKNLSSAQTFGTVIASLPDDMPCTSHCCVRAGEPIKEWLSQEPVVLDYVSGMPLLVIYEAESYSLYYVDRGELHNLVGGVDILLRPQQMLLINRNIWHMQYADLPVSFLTVSFRAAVDSPCSSLCGQVLALTARQITLLRRMLDEHSSTDFAYDCVESLLKLLLADLIRCEKKRSFQPAAQLPSTSHAEQRIADQLVQIISSKAGEKITLQQLADAAHISTTYLHRIFRTQLGMTPGNYLAKIRIEESKLLLRDGTLSMGEISLRMGFSSQQHFSRQFRTVAGMTPSEYVRTLR